jgi:hypothetical protein
MKGYLTKELGYLATSLFVGWAIMIMVGMSEIWFWFLLLFFSHVMFTLLTEERRFISGIKRIKLLEIIILMGLSGFVMWGEDFADSIVRTIISSAFLLSFSNLVNKFFTSKYND